MNENGTQDPGAAGAQPSQPTQPPASQPAQYAPSQQQAPGAPQPSQPKKGNKTIIVVTAIAAILGLLLCCCLGAGFFFYQGESTTQAQIDEIVVHLDAAGDAAVAMDAVWADWQAANLQDTPPTEAASEQIEIMRTELAAAAEGTDALRDSTFKTEMSTAITSLEEALVVYEEFFVEIEELWALANTIEEQGTSTEQARSKLNDAVKEMNSKDYADGKKLATEAKSELDALAGEYRTLTVEHPDLEFDKLVVAMEKESEQAAHVIKQGELGPNGSVSAYNKEVDAYNDLSSEIVDLPYPAWINNPALLMASGLELYDQAVELTNQALEAGERAAEAAQAGDY